MTRINRHIDCGNAAAQWPDVANGLTPSEIQAIVEVARGAILAEALREPAGVRAARAVRRVVTCLTPSALAHWAAGPVSAYRMWGLQSGCRRALRLGSNRRGWYPRQRRPWCA
jgi:hypothetical protein